MANFISYVCQHNKLSKQSVTLAGSSSRFTIRRLGFILRWTRPWVGVRCCVCIDGWSSFHFCQALEGSMLGCTVEITERYCHSNKMEQQKKAKLKNVEIEMKGKGGSADQRTYTDQSQRQICTKFPSTNTTNPTCRSSSRRILSSSFRLSSSLFDSSFFRSSRSASSA